MLGLKLNHVSKRGHRLLTSTMATDTTDIAQTLSTQRGLTGSQLHLNSQDISLNSCLLMHLST